MQKFYQHKSQLYTLLLLFLKINKLTQLKLSLIRIYRRSSGFGVTNPEQVMGWEMGQRLSDGSGTGRPKPEPT